MKSFVTQITTSALLAVCLLGAQPAAAAIANVQSNKVAGTGFGMSINITVDALTVGNVVYVGGGTSESNTLTPSATGVTFTPIHTAVNHSGAANVRLYLWRGVVDTGGATTITVTANASAVIGAWALEFSGVLTSSDTDQTDTGESAMAGTSHDLCSITTTTADQVIVVVSGATSAVTWTAGASYTVAHTGSNRIGGEFRIVAATNTYTTPITQNLSTDELQVVASFKATAAAGSSANGSLSLLGVGN